MAISIELTNVFSKSDYNWNTFPCLGILNSVHGTRIVYFVSHGKGLDLFWDAPNKSSLDMHDKEFGSYDMNSFRPLLPHEKVILTNAK